MPVDISPEVPAEHTSVDVPAGGRRGGSRGGRRGGNRGGSTGGNRGGNTAGSTGGRVARGYEYLLFGEGGVNSTPAPNPPPTSTAPSTSAPNPPPTSTAPSTSAPNPPPLWRPPGTATNTARGGRKRGRMSNADRGVQVHRRNGRIYGFGTLHEGDTVNPPRRGTRPIFTPPRYRVEPVMQQQQQTAVMQQQQQTAAEPILQQHTALEPNPLQNTNVIDRSEDVEQVSMRAGGCSMRGGAVFSSIPRGSAANVRVSKKPSPVKAARKSNRISGGLGKKLNGMTIDLSEDE